MARKKVVQIPVTWDPEAVIPATDGREGPWYGRFGGCAICGSSDTDARYSPLIPRAVRYWDPDDGWRRGVLCLGCGDECRPPRPGDYAYRSPAAAEDQATRADVQASMGDADSWVMDE